MKCPYKQSPEWLLLESYFGEVESYRIWISNNEELPSIEEIEALKKGENTSLIHKANLSKGINRLKDGSGKAMPHKNVTAFVDTLTWAVFNIRESLIKDGEGAKPKKIIDVLKKDLEAHKEFYLYHSDNDEITEDDIEDGAFPTKEENELVAEYYKHILDNFNEYIDLVTTKINTMGYSFKMNSSIKETSESILDNSTEQDAVDEEFTDETTSEEVNNFQDGATFLENPFNKLSAEIKKLISFIPNTEPNIIGKSSFVNQQAVYSTLLDIFANKELTFEEGIKELEQRVIAKPYLQELINLLKDPKLEEHTKIRFNAQFKHNYLTHTTQKIETKGNETVGNNFNTNRNNQQQVLLEDWLTASITSEVFKSNVDGSATVKNTEFIENILTPQWNKIKESNYDTSEVQAFLDMLGIDVDIEILDYIKSNSKNELGLGWEALFTNTTGNGTFKQIYDVIFNLKPDLDIETDNPLNTEQQVKKLAAVVLKFKDTVVTDNFMNGENKSIYSYVNPTWLVNRFNRIKANKDKIREKLSSLPIGKFSYYLKMLDASKNFREHFNIKVFDTLKKDDFALKFDKMSPREKLITQINLFINRQQGKPEERISEFLTPSKSDKTTIHTITATRYNVKSTTVNFNNRTFNDNDKQVLLNLVRGEFARIKDAQKKRSEGIDFKDINGYNPFMFYNYPVLNMVTELKVGDELIDWEDSITIEGQTTTVKDFIWQVIKEDTYDQINDLKDELEDLGILELNALHSDYFKENSVEHFLADYIINYNIFRVNYDVLFNGDPATAFKKNEQGTRDNIFKRLAKEIAPARRAAKLESNKDFQRYNQIFLEDAWNGSLNIEQLKSIFGNESRVVKAYSSIESTDAQELTTLEEHLNVMYYMGKIESPIYKKLIKKAKSGSEFNEEELDVILQPMKPVYVGNKFMTEYNVDLPVYIKTSSFPLVPQLVKNTEFAVLERQMRKHKIQRATFLTGAKLGAFKTIDVWNKVTQDDKVVEYDGKALTNGTFNEDVLNKALKNGAFLQLDRDNFGIQQETPYDADKSSILEGSQISKLILNGLRGNKETIDKFNELHNTIIENAYKDLLDEISATENADGSYNFTNITKFAELLEKELKERGGYTENDLLALTLNDSKTDFKIPIWSNPKSNQFEALLNSIINKRVIRQKIAGKSYILGTEEGFRGNSPEINYIKEEQLTGTRYDKKTGLKSQRYGYVKNGVKKEESDYLALSKEDKEGYTKVVFPAQILVAKGNFKGKQMVGYRIPTQDLNSMSAMEVVGYLPEYMGDLLIASKDFTKQMGSDFDIDKIYVHRWYEGRKGQKYNIESVMEEWTVITDAAIKKDSDPIRVAETLVNGFGLGNIFGEDKFGYSEEEVQEVIDFVLVKFPTQEEYIEKRKTKILKNEIVDIYWNTLTDLDNLPAILKPLDEGNLKTVKENIEKAEKNNDTQRHHLSPLHQLDNYENGTAGKIGVSMTSLTSTFNAQLLASPTDINITVVDANNEVIQFAFKIGDEIIETTSLNTSDKTLDGNAKKADTISAFQSVSVDNIKELIIKKVNYNKDTHDAFVFLSLLGLNDEYISYFLAQPSIKQFVTELQTLDDSFAKNPKGRFNEALEKILDKLVGEEINKAKLEVREPKNINEATFKWNKPYSKEELLSAIGKNDPFTQALLLQKFITFSANGRAINDVIRAIQPGTSGVGKDRAAANNKELMYEEAFSSETITGLQGLVTNTVAGKGIEILKRSNNLYNRFFKINTVVRKLVDQVNNNRGSNTRALTEKEQKQFINFSKSYIFSSALNMYYGRNVQQYRKDLLFGNNTLADKWSVFKKDNPDSWLAQRINIIPTNNINKPKFITYRASVKDETADVRNVSELIEMLESEDLSTRELAEDTIAYTYLTGGTQNAISLLKFIPIEYLNHTRFGEHVHHSLNNVNPVVLLEQFLKHYPYYATKVDNTFREEDGLLKSDKNKGNYVASQEGYKWKLYKKIDANEVGFVYKPTDTLGTFGSSETNFNTIDTESVFESNQTNKKEIEIKSLSSIEEHIDSSVVEVKYEEPIKEIKSTEIIGKQELKDNEEFNENYDDFIPLEQLKDEDYLNKQDKDLKNKYFKDSNTSTIEDILTKISNSKHPLNTLAKQLIKYAKVSNVAIELVNANDNRLTGRAAAHYDRKTNTILLKEGVAFKGLGSEPTILHEIIHALTVKEMINNPNDKLVQEINTLFEYASKHIPDTVYGMKNKYEFVAELFTNADFINRLKDIPATEGSKYKNFLQEFFDKVLQLLGINKSNTLYEQAFALSTNIIESQYEKFKLEQESLSTSDFDNSFDSPIFDEYTDEEITELIKRCK